MTSIFCLCFVFPIITWYFIISECLGAHEICTPAWPCKPELGSIYDIWVYFYGLLSLYPGMSILLNFKERSKYSPRIWHRDRWSALLRGDYQHDSKKDHIVTLLNEPLNSDKSSLDSHDGHDSHKSESTSNEPGHYTLPIKHKHSGKKLKLDKSLTSLYFLSKISYKDDPKFPNAMREMNCFGNASI